MKGVAIAFRLLLITIFAYGCTEDSIESDTSILEASLISHERAGDPPGKFTIQFMRKSSNSGQEHYVGLDFTVHSPGIEMDSTLMHGKYHWISDFASTAPFTISSIFIHDATSLDCGTEYHTLMEDVSHAEITVERQDDYFVIQYKIITREETFEAAYVGPLNRIRYVE
jgi:hypothetical protein